MFASVLHLYCECGEIENENSYSNENRFVSPQGC